jgi:hypothetical protein
LGLGGDAGASERSSHLSPRLAARFVLNRCGARTVIARETAETLADHDPPVLRTAIGQRVIYADAAQSGRLAFEIDDDGPAARDRRARQRDRATSHREDRIMTILTGDCRHLMPAHGPFDLILADPPYGDTSLAWDRRVGWITRARDALHPTGSLWVFGSLRCFMATRPLRRRWLAHRAGNRLGETERLQLPCRSLQARA